VPPGAWPPAGPPPDQGYAPDPGYAPGQGYAPDPGYVPPDQGYAPDPGYAPPFPSEQGVPPGYAEPVQPDPAVVEPQYLPPGYPPSQPPPPRRSSPVFAPLLAAIGLVLVAAASFFAIDYISGALDDGAVAGEDPSPRPVAAADPDVETPAPVSVEATAEPAIDVAPTDEPEVEETLAPTEISSAPVGETADVTGSILFTRFDGDIWMATGRELRNMTATNSSREDSSPTWAADGKHIYFIRRGQRETDRARWEGKYTLYPTDLMRIRADGNGKPKVVYQSTINSGGRLWFSHVLQPSVSSNNSNVAVVSDGPDGAGDVRLHVVNARTGKMRKTQAPSDLGHNDPDFSRDGTQIAYTYNDAAGTQARPRIAIYKCKSRANCSQGSTRFLKTGFANPSWSPDNKWLAAEATDGTGRNIVILGASKGDVRARLTTDGNSFAPEVSPDGNQIAYLKRDGTAIDLRVMTLDVDARGFPTLLADQAVTTDGLVDGASNPSWYIPKRLLKNPDLAVEPVDTADDLGADETSTDGENASEGAPPPPV
jgi:Tol biopolymer transport system component